MNRSILHPTRTDLHDYCNSFDDNRRFSYSQFYYEECKVGYLYEKWMNQFIENGMLFNNTPDIIKFEGQSYTSFTYKFCFNFPNSEGVYGGGYKIKTSDYELFAKLFLTEKWRAELYDIKNNVKPWVDYLTFQGSRIILQFRFDSYLKTEGRKEKLQKLNTI